MKKIIAFIGILVLFVFVSRSDEGMWLPLLLSSKINYMQAMGLKLSAEDIYSINQPSLKDAIVLFGGGCTGEIVSKEGLLFTNHHCGYSAIQSHSSLTSDYLTNGFWAMNKAEELPNPGLKVSILVKMEDVTDDVLKGVTNVMAEAERSKIIEKNISRIVKKAVENTHYEASVKSFYYGNEYYLVVYEVFKDVRLVGAPPSSIGKFGGDTDNWVWPRHTGDFAVFRIYADKNNQPADYSPNNVPYKPRKYLPISLKGYNEGDFTFVFGYPGNTNQYVPSYEINMVINYENPISVALREKKLSIIDNYMKKDKLIRIQYSAKYANIANFWKKMIGEAKGLKETDVINKKQFIETQFQQWANSLPERKDKYGELLSEFEVIYKQLLPINVALIYIVEAGLGVEIVKFAWSFNNLLVQSKKTDVKKKDIDDLLKTLKNNSVNFFKNYNSQVDKEIFIALMKEYYYNLPDKQYIPSEISFNVSKYKGDFNLWADKMYAKSLFTSYEKITKFLEKYDKKQYKKIEKDPCFKLAKSIYDLYFNKLRDNRENLTVKLDSLQRIYMNGLKEMLVDKQFYPDANSTLRIAYGKIEGFSPADAIQYLVYTTTDGILQKEDTSIYDYIVDPKLKKLIYKKDYDKYVDKDGKMHVAFIASNHTTGGNSGSPVLNSEGQLIGINFDRCWEGTMSDYYYDISRCRNISLDIRYCLFIIDKFAGAGYLLDEMTLVE